MGGDRRYRELFDERGTSYDDAMRRWPAARAEEFRFVVHLARPRVGEVLIDVPAGGGYLADHLPAGVEVLAVETSDPFARQCAARGLAVVAGDLAATALPDGCADLVVSVAGMHHEPDHAGLFAAWRRLLRPGGRLVAADVVAGSPEAALLDGFVGAHNGTGHRGWFFGEDLAGIVAGAGYDDVRVVDGRYRWWAGDPLELARFCTGLFGLVGAEPAEVVAALEEAIGLERGAGRCGLPWGLRAVVASAA